MMWNKIFALLTAACIALGAGLVLALANLIEGVAL